MYIKKQIGTIGENFASEYLKEKEYKILERNYRSKQGKIDIIAYDTKQNEIAFIEVKTRNSIKYGTPAEAVNITKQKHIIKVAKYYIYTNKSTNNKFRFDVIEVFLNNSKYEINHIIKAFST